MSINQANIAGVVAELRRARLSWRKRHQAEISDAARRLPSTEAVRQTIAQIRGALFPLRLGDGPLDPSNEDRYVTDILSRALTQLSEQIILELTANGTDEAEHTAEHIVSRFAQELPQIRQQLDTDVEAAFYGDPAARSFDEVLLCYPGLAAIMHHRIAHQLHRLGAPLVARIIAEGAHSLTGIDIHPGATVGSYFFIDHGTGVVIGETAVIGERVRIYQAVTLGARSFPRDETGKIRKDLPRHPIIEDDVVIYAGATILGRVTIGMGSIIGGNVWLTESVVAGSRINQATSVHAADADLSG